METLCLRQFRDYQEGRCLFLSQYSKRLRPQNIFHYWTWKQIAFSDTLASFQQELCCRHWCLSEVNPHKQILQIVFSSWNKTQNQHGLDPFSRASSLTTSEPRYKLTATHRLLFLTFSIRSHPHLQFPHKKNWFLCFFLNGPSHLIITRVLHAAAAA